jgi:sortase A
MLALLGIGLLAYPCLASWLFDRHASMATQSYDDSVAAASAGQREAAWQQAVEYNQNLEGNPVHDPFLKGSGMALSDDYAATLSIGEDDAMGYVEIPEIDVKLPIYHGSSEATLQQGAGHLEGSSLPIGGIGSHSVLTGHTGLVHARMFTDLIKLEEGDVFYLHVLDRVLAYQVDQILVVEPSNITPLRRDANRDLCTLVTCTPYGVNSHRLMVRGHRIDYQPGDEQAQGTPAGHNITWLPPDIMLVCLVAGLDLVVLLAWLLWRSRRRLAVRQASSRRGVVSNAHPQGSRLQQRRAQRCAKQ